MRTLLSSLLLSSSFLLNLNSSAQNTFPSIGNAGIGTTGPLKLLHVNGQGAFGNRVTSANATRVLNLIDDNAVMRILRVHATNAPAVELLSRTSANGANLAYWDMYAQPTDASFRIRDRVGGGSGFDRLTISRSGRVGVGTSSPVQNLHVVGNAVFTGHMNIGSTVLADATLDVKNSNRSVGLDVTNTFIGNIHRTGISSSSVNNPGYGTGISAVGGYTGVIALARGGNNPTGAQGVLAWATGETGSGTYWGIAGTASGGANAYGVHGRVERGASFNAAGYFTGDVHAYRFLILSDRKFKDRIEPMRHSLNGIMKLKPVAYQFKTTEYKSMQLPQGKQIGFIADEVKDVFPELVSHAVHPAEYDKVDRHKITSPEVKYEGINYQGLIPVLVASVQELFKMTEAENSELKQQNSELLERIEKLEEVINQLASAQKAHVPLTNAFLSEVAPNPVKGTAVIQYGIPDGSTRAQLLVTDALGRQLRCNSRDLI